MKRVLTEMHDSSRIGKFCYCLHYALTDNRECKMDGGEICQIITW